MFQIKFQIIQINGTNQVDVSDDNGRDALFRGKSVIFHILSWYTYLNLEMRFKKI